MQTLAAHVLARIDAARQRNADRASGPSSPTQHRHRIEAGVYVYCRADVELRIREWGKARYIWPDETDQVVAGIKGVFTWNIVARAAERSSRRRAERSRVIADRARARRRG